MKKTVLIIGAGPAGLTAAYELLSDTSIQSILIEADKQVGGISKTINHNGNRMDLGGHRFFSKSDWVMSWWRNILPIHTAADSNAVISYHNQSKEITLDSNQAELGNCMLLRPRLSRIYFLRKFFDYPIKLNANTMKNLGFVRLTKIAFSYLFIRINPIKNEKNLQDFITNRFGKELYLTFFKNYTEKVWGVPCEQISAEWGAQRIKGLSITATIKHAINKIINRTNKKTQHTSLIEQFLYPRLGPGQMWEAVADKITSSGAEIRKNLTVKKIHMVENIIKSVEIEDHDGNKSTIQADYFISTMPVRDLINGISPPPPEKVLHVANGLLYRDFITVGIKVKKLIKTDNCIENNLNLLPDNWIYIQEPDVKLGRLQIFNNWSTDLVADENSVWLGLEYFCNEDDELWSMPSDQFADFAASELSKIGIIEKEAILDKTVVYVPKAYPAYFGSYDQFSVIRDWTDSIENLFLIGRNGMHRYNNQDHSMLTAKLAAESIISGENKKAEMWAVNLDDDYHEEKIKT